MCMGEAGHATGAAGKELGSLGPPWSTLGEGPAPPTCIRSCSRGLQENCHNKHRRHDEMQSVLGTLYNLPSHANLCSDVRPVPRELPRAPGLGPYRA